MDNLIPNGSGRNGAIQKWVAPVSSKYRITVAGAAGGLGDKPYGIRGQGAVISGDFDLAEGDSLEFVVGQLPTDTGVTVGGGGGTFAVKAPSDTRYIIYVYREGLRPVDREIMEYLILACHTPIRAMSVTEFQANSDWDNVAMVVIGYPPGDGTAYEGVGSPANTNFSTMPFPVVSFCRHTSRNTLGMQAQNSMGATTIDYVDKVSGSPDLGWNTADHVEFDQVLSDSQILHTTVAAGQVIYKTTTTNSSVTSAIVYHEQNGYPRIHWGVYRLLAAGVGLQNLFAAMVGIRPEQYQPLIVAGGGGGNNVGDVPYSIEVADASLSENGKDGIAEGTTERKGVGGLNGMGGHYDSIDRGQGGGGFYGFGVSEYLNSNVGNGEYAGFPFMAGGFGGAVTSSTQGGYGGGGSSSATTGWGVCCGGGGYSGGGAAYASNAASGATGGGGGSYNAGDNPQHVGWNDGDGWVLIQQVHTVGNTFRGDDNTPGDLVVIREWSTKQEVLQEVPDISGNWSTNISEGTYEVSYYKDGYQPVTHGPYTIEDDL